jgi:4-diphosphocytidyl-2-C-methyl-D-erythritol kinase
MKQGKLDTVKVRAHGKINLGLDVLKKREDGYHEVRMIMQMVGLYDQIEINRLKNPKDKQIIIETNLKYLPTNENNLAYKAAKILMDEFLVEDGVNIKIKKMIPVAAGMAGGSTDAAAVMIGINKMFSLNLTVDELMERGVKLGADVPYCIMGGTALAEGIGEKLTMLTKMMPCFIVLAKPGINVSTKFVYGNLSVNEIQKHPDIDGLIKALDDGDFNAMADKIGNVLEEVTIKEYPIIEEIKKLMLSEGAKNAMMSGSGPTVFGLFDDRIKAKNAYNLLKESSLCRQVYITDGGNGDERY